MKYQIGEEVQLMGAIGKIVGIANDKKKIYYVDFGNYVTQCSELSLSPV